MKIILHDCFSQIISVDNLLSAWQEFAKGKRGREDVQEFSFKLMDNILALHFELLNGEYKHGAYQSFFIHDPKQRQIHKASIRDRLLHHAVFRVLYPFFERTFVPDSFSSRKGKGTHRALKRFRDFGYKISENNTKTCWVLKCDIRKFFASIDHGILLEILKNYIYDQKALGLLAEIICSHSSNGAGVGLPLGNLTSQLFVNIYLGELDRFVKHDLRAKYYIRYADDFIVLFQNKEWLSYLQMEIGKFLSEKLRLTLHPNKIFIETLASGIDFLGYVVFPNHKLLRTKTKKRVLARVSEKNLPFYLGVLSHCNSYGLEVIIREIAKAEAGKSLMK